MQPTHKRDDNWSRLLLRVGKQRDQRAFEHLFAHFVPLIKGFCHSRPNLALSAEAAEELIQDVMFHIWQNAPSFEARKGSASTWIFTVVRNCRIDMLRRNSQYLSTDNSAPDRQLDVRDIWPDTTDNQPFVFLQQVRSEDMVGHSLQKLPVEQSHVIKKIYMEGKSHSEIAAELGLPLGTVRSRVRLALQKLRESVGS